MIMYESNRSVLVRFRYGMVPIRIEIGRYERNRELAENKTCFHCVHDVEDEFHVLHNFVLLVSFYVFHNSNRVVYLYMLLS